MVYDTGASLPIHLEHATSGFAKPIVVLFDAVNGRYGARRR